MKTLSKTALTLILSSFVLTLGACSRSELTGSPFSNTPNHNFDGIIGGTDVQPADPIAKHTAILWNRYANGSICTVTLLDQEYAVTAAHCVEMFLFDPGAFRLGFGTDANLMTEARPVISIRLLPSRPGMEAELFDTRDLALIKFAHGLPRGYEGVSILSPEQLGLLQKGTPTIVAGYGVNKWDSSTPPPLKDVRTLRKVQLDIWNPKFAGTEILLDQRHGKAACRGDSGGPAFIEIGGKLFFWGIASRGTDEKGLGLRSNECSQFVVYTNAIYWIPALIKLRTSTPGGDSPSRPPGQELFIRKKTAL